MRGGAGAGRDRQVAYLGAVASAKGWALIAEPGRSTYALVGLGLDRAGAEVHGLTLEQVARMLEAPGEPGVTRF